MVRYYTLIGSRETPDEVMLIMKTIASELDKKGWCGRSGGANGADSCLNHISNKEVYLPWNNFNDHKKNWKEGYVVYSELNYVRECDNYCKLHHQYWSNIKKESVKHLHRRNIHQILGATLRIPSDIVICYAPPDENRGEGHVLGGTGTAVSLALSKNIPVCNLYFKNNITKIYNYIENLGD